MRKITVRKDDLIRTLKKNREAHQKTFQEAYTKFLGVLDTTIEALWKKANTAPLDRLDRVLDIEIPVDMTHHYDLAISMMEWDTAETVELTETEFRQYIRDEWDWQGEWANNTLSYVGKG